MTIFAIVAAIMVLAALAAVIVPLLRKPKGAAQPGTDSAAMSLEVLREQLADLEREFAAGHLTAEHYAAEKAELERRALEDGQRTTPVGAPTDARRPKLAAAVGIAVPVLVLGMYYAMGSIESLTGQQPQPVAESGDASHALTRQDIEAMVGQLAERLMENPEDGQGWHMLGRSYAVLGRHAESAAAYARAVNLLPPDAQLLSDYADVLAMMQGRKLEGEPEKVIRLALQTDPRNIKALALSGSVAFERKDYRAAAGEWRKILDLVPPDSDISTSIRSSIADAESRIGGDSTPAPAQPAAAAAVISGSVALDPALRGKAGPDNAVFIFAHAVNGPRMPLAILRKKVSDLPFEFTLDDSMAMSPDLRLSQFGQVTVGARISMSGDALQHSGDLVAAPVQTGPGAGNIRLSIASVVK
ncbi:MAG: c-type cytochrome biogenesis protein CcmI [Gallionellales bacterium GWA2_60_18]|nr:MAG: c-type cytochrome biogenesis protein CcmI [Gallionellales bacterium GWA2_60_18]